MAPSTSGAAQWAVDRPCDGGRLGCVGRVGPTSPLTGPTGLLNLPALATLARHREPMGRAFHELFREQTLARRHATTGVVCLGRDAVARVLCGHLDALDLGAESEGRGDDQTTSSRFRRPMQTRWSAPIHCKAMPVTLTTPEEIDTWTEAPVGAALQLQRPLADCALIIVDRGEKQDEGGPAA